MCIYLFIYLSIYLFIYLFIYIYIYIYTWYVYIYIPMTTHLFETAGKVRNCSWGTVYTRWMPSSRKPTNRAVDILDSFKLKAHLHHSWTHGRWAYRLLKAHDRNRFFHQGRSAIWLLMSCGGKCTLCIRHMHLEVHMRIQYAYTYTVVYINNQ